MIEYHKVIQFFCRSHIASAHLSDPTTDVAYFISPRNAAVLLPSDSFYINSEQIFTILKNLKTKKSPVIDGINNSCLKSLPKKVVRYLVNIINECFLHRRLS